MKTYTMVLVFDPEFKHVLLLQKAKPLWQKGLYNGPGGSAEDNETWYHCAQREMKEETGLDVGNLLYSLTFSCNCTGGLHDVVVYGATKTLDEMMAAKGSEAEPLVIFELDYLQNNQKMLAGDCWHLICITKTRLEQGNEIRTTRDGK